MRRFSLREKAKTILLCAASLNLGLSSELPWLGIIFFAAFIVLLFRYDVSRVPVYRKSVAYGLIVPFAIWWVLSPEMEYGMSPWLVFIPAYYLLSLAYLQKRSLGNGGYDVFVLFNGVAVLLLSCFQASRYGVLLNVFALLLLLHAYARPGVKWWKHALFLLLFLGLSAVSFGGLKYWQSHGHNRAERMADYYAKRHLMGFDPVVKLGSFESNFAGKYNREVVLRVWDSLPPTYMRAAVYEKYVGGIWKLPAHRDRMLYASRYKVDYAVFETRDSVASADSSRPVWVLLSALGVGCIMDLALGGAGLYTASLLPVAVMRRSVMYVTTRRSVEAGDHAELLSKLSLTQLMLYIGAAMALHHILFFVLETLSFKAPFLLLAVIVASTIVSMLLAWPIARLFLAKVVVK